MDVEHDSRSIEMKNMSHLLNFAEMPRLLYYDGKSSIEQLTSRLRKRAELGMRSNLGTGAWKYTTFHLCFLYWA